ncbi:TPA: EscU/YscU/HrcU family type III secretion system export apparatus switch protein [Enterobacter roggenkampii]|nr:EscU/YscU/HrcU family type III secretion system export apparatus switch protein [Enterobacter roggenkampii]
MSEEKTLPPTQKKIDDAREEGQVASSPEVASGFQLAIILLYFYIWGDDIWGDLSRLLLVSIDVTSDDLTLAFEKFLAALSTLLLKDFCFLAVLLFFGTVAAYLMQIGFLFSSKAVMPKIENLDVMKQLKKIFSAKSIVELIKNLCKMFVVGSIFWYLLSHYAPSFQNMVFVTQEEAIKMTATIIYWLWGALILCYVVFALADYAWKRHELMKSLRMSPEDMKQEHKEMEGNMEIKHKRKEMHQELQNESLENTVRKSSAVIRNPTHIAICIHYDENTSPIPRVIAKGKDHLALEIVRFAEKAGTPVIENIPVARGLMKDIAVGNFISPTYYSAIAEILWVINAQRV